MGWLSRLFGDGVSKKDWDEANLKWFKALDEERNARWEAERRLKALSSRLGHAERILRSSREQLRDTAKGRSVGVRIDRYFQGGST